MTDPNTPNESSDQESLDDVLQGLSAGESEETQSLDDILASLEGDPSSTSFDESSISEDTVDAVSASPSTSAADPAPFAPATDASTADESIPADINAESIELPFSGDADDDDLTVAFDATASPAAPVSESPTASTNDTPEPEAPQPSELISDSWDQGEISDTPVPDVEASPTFESFELPVFEEDIAAPSPEASTPLDSESLFSSTNGPSESVESPQSSETVSDPWSAPTEPAAEPAAPFVPEPNEPEASSDPFATGAQSENLAPSSASAPTGDTLDSPFTSDTSDPFQTDLGTAPDTSSDTRADAPDVPEEPIAAQQPEIESASETTAAFGAVSEPSDPFQPSVGTPSAAFPSSDASVDPPDVSEEPIAAQQPEIELPDLSSPGAVPLAASGTDGETPASPFDETPIEEPVEETAEVDAASPLNEPSIGDFTTAGTVEPESPAITFGEEPIESADDQEPLELAEETGEDTGFSGPELPDLPPLAKPASISQASIDTPSGSLDPIDEPPTLKKLLDRPRHRWIVPLALILIFGVIGVIVITSLNGGSDPDTEEIQDSRRSTEQVVARRDR